MIGPIEVTSTPAPDDSELMAILELFKDRVESVEVLTKLGDKERRFDVRLFQQSHRREAESNV